MSFDLTKARSVGISRVALGTRYPDVAETYARQARWDRDIPAYRRLRKDGLQPPTSDGAADLECSAVERHEVEGTPDPKLMDA